MPEYLILVILFFAGVSASFINMMAGGGSLITLGLMITFGVDASIANGTNRLGILASVISGATTYHQKGKTNLKKSLTYGACALPGAIIGAFYSIKIDNSTFERALGIIMILILITLFIPQKTDHQKVRKKYLLYPALFLIGFYGGFIQVGIGYLLMAALRHLGGYDLVTTNMHKVFVVLTYAIPVLVVFGVNEKINWPYAIALSLGGITGSWLSIHLALKKGETFVKMILVVAVLMVSIKLLFNFF